jgi:hypothetical protein
MGSYASHDMHGTMHPCVIGNLKGFIIRKMFAKCKIDHRNIRKAKKHKEFYV